MSKLTEEFRADQDYATRTEKVNYEKLGLAKHLLTTRPALSIEDVVRSTEIIFNSAKVAA